MKRKRSSKSTEGPEKTQDPKAYLARAPLDGVDLSRSRDFGREVDLDDTTGSTEIRQ
jgi:hypothetical protein